MTSDSEIIREEMANLPDDDELAFVVYEERLRKRTRDAQGDGSHLEREYVNGVLGFLAATNLRLPVQGVYPLTTTVFGRGTTSSRKASISTRRESAFLMPGA